MRNMLNINIPKNYEFTESRLKEVIEKLENMYIFFTYITPCSEKQFLVSIWTIAFSSFLFRLTRSSIYHFNYEDGA